MSDLKSKIIAHKARVGVMGLGYVGLPLAVEFAKAGFRVLGLDVLASKVSSIRQGRSYIPDVRDEELRALVKKGLLEATSDFSRIRELDTLSICVPTPLRKTKDPDISHIVAAIEAVARYFRKGQLIVLESTTYPGTTEELVLPALSVKGRQAGRDFFLAFSPERIDPGNARYKTRDIPKIIGGQTPKCTEMAVALYGEVVDRVIPVSSTRVAEMVKLLENTFRAVNIALANEIAILCRRMGLDVWEVIEGAATKPFGFMPFYPGPGLGGHCLPVDPIYLSWKARLFDFEARFIELAAEVNGHMPHHVVEVLSEALNARGKALKGSRILILGAAYKPDVNDVRESPALDIWKILTSRFAKVSYHDPYVSQIRVGERVFHSLPLTRAHLRDSDCVLIVTHHSLFDYPEIVRHAPLIVDTRNATKDVKHHRNKIVKI